MSILTIPGVGVLETGTGGIMLPASSTSPPPASSGVSAPLLFTGLADPPTGELALTQSGSTSIATMVQNGSGALLLPSVQYAYAFFEGLGTFTDCQFSFTVANGPQPLNLTVLVRGAAVFFNQGNVAVFGSGLASNPGFTAPLTVTSGGSVSLIGQVLTVVVDGVTLCTLTGTGFPTAPGYVGMGSANTPTPQVQIASIQVLTGAQIAAAQAAAAAAAVQARAAATAARAAAWVAALLPPARAVPNPAVATKLHSFTLTNWGTASSPGLARQGVPFCRDHVPPGVAVQIRHASGGAVVDAQFDDVVTRPNGSLLWAVCHLRDTVFAAGEVRTYEVWTVPGGTFAAAGTITPSSLVAGHTFQATFKNVLEYGDDTAASGSTPAAAAVGSAVGSGSLVADCNTHLAVSTRCERVHGGQVVDGVTAWGMATDTSGGAADAHLKVNWHIDRWKNADGSTYAVEVAAEPAQDWWSVANKKRRNYDAALVDGATTIASYPGVVHPYKSRWITCQPTGINRGKRWWVGGAQPTLSVTIDKQYWVDSGLVPPLSRTNVHASPPFQYSSTYTPCGNFDHRPNIDGTGAYNGRGIISNQDSFAFQRGTPEDIAVARLNAHAGLHVYYHYRSNRTRTKPGDTAADIANTVISPIMGISDAASGTPRVVDPYDFTAQGLPVPVHAYADYRSSADYQDGYTYAAGGGGVWSNTTNDASHAVNYSGFMHSLEGERYHLEAALDCATNLMHQGISNNYSCRPHQLSVDVGVTLPGTVALQYDAIAGIFGQERSCGWGLNLMGAALAAVPDAHVASAMFRQWNRHQAIWLHDSMACLPPDVLAAGVLPNVSEDPSAEYLNTPWQDAFVTMGAHQNAALSEDPDIRAWGWFTARATWNLIPSGYLTETYRARNKLKYAVWNPTTNPYVTTPLSGFDYYGTISAATGVFTLDVDPENHPLSQLPPINGDFAYQIGQGSSFPMQDGVKYYVVNVSANGDQWQFAATPGGTPLSFTADDPSCSLAMNPAALASYPAAKYPPYLPSADDYANIHRAAAVYDTRANGPAATTALLNQQILFVSGVDQSGWGTWDLAV